MRRLALSLMLFGIVVLAAGQVARQAPLPAPSLPGRLAYVVAGNIWLRQGGAHQLTSTGHDGSPSLSADGTQLAYVRYDDSFSDILFVPVTGGQPTFLTNNRPAAETGSKPYVDAAVWAFTPSWSPNASRLAYASDRGTDAPVLWIMTPAGENPHSLKTSPPNPPLERPQWSPDGTAIAAVSMGSGKDEVWSLNLDNGVWSEVAAPADGAYDPTWSPDGKTVAYAGRNGRQTDIYAVPADRSAAPVQLTHLGAARSPVFSPDGKQLAFLAEKDERFQVFVADLSLEKGSYKAAVPQQVTDNSEGVDAASGLSWSK